MASRVIIERTIAAGDCPSWHTATTASVIGTYTSWARARSSTERQLLTPSAVWRVLRCTSSSVMPRPSFSPNVRLRDSGELQVATRSPSPASPANVVISAPSARPRRAVSASPRVICEVTGAEPERVAALSGPNLAREIAEEQPAATVIACADATRAAALQAACHTPYFRPYTNPDMVGCELGGAVKNVIALACGVAEGLGFGDNTRASLITRGLAETARLGMVLGAELTTFAGLAGLGDLVATCSSPLSRNRTFGEKLGHGMSVEEVQESTRQTAEGVKSCRSVLDLARAHDIDVPITEAVVRVCHEGESPARMVKEIMSREAKPE